MSGEMAFAYFMRRAPNSFFPLLDGGEADGGGSWSLDRVLSRGGRG
jgi:hypothetical protein